MMVQGKVWGRTTALLQNAAIEIHEIEIEPFSKCSEHEHQHKANVFYCLEGSVIIRTVKNDYELVDTVTLRRGEATQAPATEVHWFETGAERARVLEIYYPVPLSPSDIRRHTVGSTGVHPPSGVSRDRDDR